MPAAAETRTVQSGLPKPFPSIGDAVVGCRDPANTANWVEIITGKLWERTVQDGATQRLPPSLGDVATGIRGFCHAYIRTGECSGYEDGDEVTIESKGRWYDIDMMCASDPHGGCYWIPGVDIRVVTMITAPGNDAEMPSVENEKMNRKNLEVKRSWQLIELHGLWWAYQGEMPSPEAFQTHDRPHHLPIVGPYPSRKAAEALLRRDGRSVEDQSSTA